MKKKYKLLIFLLSHFTISIQAADIIKDPTQPAGAIPHNIKLDELTDTQWQLQAVTYTDKTRRAIINGKFYQTGQNLTEQVSVYQILPNSVILLVNERKHTLTLRNTNIKTEVNGAFN
ncbi:general secretion pathway protein GspB [Catenovulum sp. 2E275]|uniref:general secretion pathway protein GspB n=1 Tax=Catenovulum sp. 2E275 TaxID=2980497 RepID=UPI0021D1C2C0|nr:general secretion pathway protein GspB [Catenovulum sp. 2E275]MCU4675056.1 general secretion pathway protein GspB [Catenovulum sp. 2E275]